MVMHVGLNSSAVSNNLEQCVPKVVVLRSNKKVVGVVRTC